MDEDFMKALKAHWAAVKANGGVAPRREIPGTESSKHHEVIYVGCQPGLSIKALNKVFDQVTLSDPPLVKYGGALAENCTLTLPSGACFVGMSYHGDLDGWRRQIVAGAQAQGVRTARIGGEQVVVDDGETAKLADCNVLLFEDIPQKKKR